MTEQRLLDFDGETFDPPRDAVRLTGQMLRVYDVMRDGKWHTLAELADRAQGAEAGVSARIRDLRKPRFGGHEVDRKRIDGGLWWYRLVLRDVMLRGQKGDYQREVECEYIEFAHSWWAVFMSREGYGIAAVPAEHVNLIELVEEPKT